MPHNDFFFPVHISDCIPTSKRKEDLLVYYLLNYERWETYGPAQQVQKQSLNKYIFK